MIPKGLGAKIAFREGSPAGFVEFLPIEVAPAPVKGKGILFITDIHINDDDDGGSVDFQGKGLGRKLIASVEAYARQKRFNALATLALDGTWMPAAFYEKLGFSAVDSAGDMRLLWKPFAECSHPELWPGDFQPTIGRGVVHIDLVHSSQCWGMILQAVMWKRISEQYQGKVVVEDHLTDEREVMSMVSMTGSIGVFVDGIQGPGHPIGEEQAHALIEQALKRKADNKSDVGDA